MDKVRVLVVGLFVLVGLAVPAAAYSYMNWYIASPPSTTNSGLPSWGISGGTEGGGTDLGMVSAYDPFSILGENGLFDNVFGSDMFQTDAYGLPPTDNITKALVGQLLPYNIGIPGSPLEYQVKKSDIGNIAGTQYDGQDAWDVRVGQGGMYWDVIMDSTGNQILAENQAQ